MQPSKPGARSITLRLPLLILALLSVVIAGLGWSSYTRLTATLERAATERLGGATTQIVGLLQQSIVRVRKEATAITTDPAVVRAVVHATPASLGAARVALARKSDTTEQLSRTLWTRGCEVVLAIGVSAAPSETADCPASPMRWHDLHRPRNARAWVQPFVARGDTVSYDVIAPILTASGDTAGFLQTTRTLRANESGKVVGRLVGSDVAFMLGNADGSTVWTDLTRRVHGPILQANHRGAFEWLDDHEVRQFGVARTLPLAP